MNLGATGMLTRALAHDLAGRASFGAWREGQHDDLVMAAALACWRAVVKGKGRRAGTQGGERRPCRLSNASGSGDDPQASAPPTNYNSPFTVNIMLTELRQIVATESRHPVSKYCRR